MSPRALRVAAPLVLAYLLFFPAFVVSLGINVTANCTDSTYFWTFNSLGQSPCLVAATMLATCYADSYTLLPLPTGYAYAGPTHDYSNKCQCSTVGFSLISACVACQDRKPFYWSAYVANCTSVMPPSQFPNAVPAGINVPHWAVLDVTNENTWNANESYLAGDNPEYGPGAIFGPTGVYTSGVSTSSSSPSPTATSKGKSSNGGAIAGGVVGGIAIVSIAAAAIFYLRRRSRAASTSSTVFDPLQSHMNEIPRPMSDGGTLGQSSSQVPSSPYQTQVALNDQNAFQGYTGVHSVDIMPGPGSTLSHVGSANMHTSLPQSRVYHGLPMPAP